MGRAKSPNHHDSAGSGPGIQGRHENEDWGAQKKQGTPDSTSRQLTDVEPLQNPVETVVFDTGITRH